MKKSSKITIIAIAVALVILIAAIVIAIVRMGSVESNLCGLWEKNSSGYTDTLALGDDNSVLLVYGIDETTEYYGTWEKGSSIGGTTEINITLDMDGEVNLVLYMMRYHGKYVLLSDKTDPDSAFTRVSDLSIIDETTK